MRVPSARNFPVFFALCFLMGSVVTPVFASDADERLDFANGLFSRRIYTMAVDEYKKFVSAYPDNPKAGFASFMTAEAYFYGRSYDEAVKSYREYLQRYPGEENNPVAILRICAVFLQTGRFDEAVSEAGAILGGKYAPSVISDAFYFSGAAKISRKEKVSGMADLQSSVITDENSVYAPYAAYQLGGIYLADNDNDNALFFFKRSFELADDLESSLSALFGIAQVHLNRQEFVSAADILKEIVFDPQAGEELRSKAYLNLLQVLYNIGDYYGVAAVYRDLGGSVRPKPSVFASGLIVARAYREMGWFDRACFLIDTLSSGTDITQDERDELFLEKVSFLLVARDFNAALDLLKSRPELASLARYSYLEAESYFYLKDYPAASGSYARVISSPSSGEFRKESLYCAAYSELENGNKAQARDYFFAFAEGFADDNRAASALYSAINMDAELGLIDEGINHCRIYLDRYGNDEKRERVLFLLGKFYTDKKDYASAVSVYEDYIKVSPSSPRTEDVYLALGYNYQMLEERAKSNEYYSRVKKRTEGDKTYYLAQKNMLQNYLSEGDEGSALGALDVLLCEYDGNGQGIDAYFWLIDKYLEKKRFSDAMRILDKAKDRQETAKIPAYYAYCRAEALKGMGRFDEALDEYDKSVKADGGESDLTGKAILGKGLVLLARGDYDGADKLMDEALAFKPDDYSLAVRARFNKAEIYSRKGDFESAARMYMMVGILYDDNTYVPGALIKAGESFQKAGKAQEAVKAYNDFLSRFPDDPRAGDIKGRLDGLRGGLNVTG